MNHNPILTHQKTYEKKQEHDNFVWTTFQSVERFHKDIAGFDLSYTEFEASCHKTWEEDFKYVCINKSKNKEKENIPSSRKQKHIHWLHYWNKTFLKLFS